MPRIGFEVTHSNTTACPGSTPGCCISLNHRRVKVKLYTIGEAAAILDITHTELCMYIVRDVITTKGDSRWVKSTDLEKIREARRYRPL